MVENLQRSIVEPRDPRLNVSRNRGLPHSPGVRAGDYIFISGMGPLIPETGERELGPIVGQIRRTLTNMQHMLESAGSSMERVVRIHLVIAEPLEMAEVEGVYREFFPAAPPSRTMVSMQLRNGNGCEIECVALAG